MLRFHLFGIPINIEPWFWVSSFLLGGGLHIGSGNRSALKYVLIWMILVFVSILVHELGHALSGRRMAGGRPSIRLWAFGGLASNEGGRWTKKSLILMTLAGPGAGFLLFGATVGGILIAFPGAAGWDLCKLLAFGGPLPKDLRVLEFLSSGSIAIYVLQSLLWINLWWGLVNLLPIYPLDGGQIAMELVPSRRRTHLIGVVAAGLVVVIALSFHAYYIAAMFGFLGWQNFENMKRLRF